MKKPSIDVLLATYNSGIFLSAQLDSLLNQTRQDFRILIRDDGSTDSTPALLEAARQAHPDRITLLPPGVNGGFLANFHALMQASSADILFFCDHDDVWLPEKIAKTAERMQQMMDSYGEDVPLCVHCDAFLCDGELNTVHSSLHRAWKMGRTPEDTGYPVDIPIFGCGMAINRKLKEFALPLAPDCISHDTWCGRIAWYLGHVAFIDEPLMKYRVHKSNVSCGSSQRYPQVLFRYFDDFRKARLDLCKHLVPPTALFAERFGGQLRESDRKRLETFGRWSRYGLIRRIFYLARFGLYANGAIRTIGLLVL